MHNFGSVFRFEVRRSLKKKSFWILSLLFPFVIAAVFAIVYFADQASKQATLELAKQHLSIDITDLSHTIRPTLLQKIHGHVVASKQQGIEKVRKGLIDAYIYVPADPSRQQVEIYAKDAGLFDNSRYQHEAQALLEQSILPTVDPTTRAILAQHLSFHETTYRNGQPYDDIKQLIVPGMFLVLFYLLISMFGNQMLTSTTEEKENRVIEMLLTAVNARTLIIGKLVSLLVLACLQIIVIMVPVSILYVLLADRLALPNLDISHAVFDPGRIGLGALIFFFSFLLFTGLLVAIGSAVPTAKEASSFFGIVMLLIFGPLYAAMLFISSPTSGLVRFLTIFPFTAPIPLLLRNAVGNLSPLETLISLTILIGTSLVVLAIAIRLFQYGALEYSRRLSIVSLLKSSKRRARP